MKILTIIGARPQFVKAAVVSRELLKFPEKFHEVVVHTGQHYDKNMSGIFFRELEIAEPNYNLGIGGGTHGENTGRMIEQIEAVMLKEMPAWIMVYGDTDSTLAGAIAASKIGIRIAHVEAGLRSFNRKMPEEVNRVVTDHLSSLLFAPTAVAKQNLLREGIASEMVKVVGDVMYDAALTFKEKARKPHWFDELWNVKRRGTGFALCTIHRAENVDDTGKLLSILRGLELSERFVVIPIHPRTHLRLKAAGIKMPDNVSVVDPVGYLEMIWLETECEIVVTDSGGIQKEAYFHKKPCVTLRSETEWLELVEIGCNRLVGTNSNAIADAMHSLRWNAPDEFIYGDGRSASTVVGALS